MNMKKSKAVMLRATVLCTSIMATGCGILGPDVQGSGEIVSEKRELPAFTGININNDADVAVTYGTAQSVEISTDDNILPLITMQVSNGVLKIDSKESYSTSHGVKVTITVPTLESIEIDGSGDVVVQNAQLENLPVTNFRIDIDGSGNVQIPSMNAATISMDIEGSGNVQIPSLEATNVSVEVEGSGDISIAGNGGTLTVELEGSGNIKAEEFQTLNSIVKVEGSGDVRVNATESLDAHISGSGDVYYRGNPRAVKTGVTGSGDFIKLP